MVVVVATTSFDDDTGSPANVTIAPETNITTAKAISFFIFVCYTDIMPCCTTVVTKSKL